MTKKQKQTDRKGISILGYRYVRRSYEPLKMVVVGSTAGGVMIVVLGLFAAYIGSQ